MGTITNHDVHPQLVRQAKATKVAKVPDADPYLRPCLICPGSPWGVGVGYGWGVVSPAGEGWLEQGPEPGAPTNTKGSETPAQAPRLARPSPPPWRAR